MKTMASVHRFHDKVAVYVGNGGTTYLTAKQARKLARALAACAKSVVDEKFVDSSFGIAEVLEVTSAQEGAEIGKFPRNKEKAK